MGQTNTYMYIVLGTFDMNESVKKTDGFKGEEMSQVFHAHSEGVPVVQL